jgi:uncharacterized protein YkwD
VLLNAAAWRRTLAVLPLILAAGAAAATAEALAASGAAQRGNLHVRHHAARRAPGAVAASSGSTITPPVVPAVCPDQNLVPTPDNLARAEQATMCLVNQRRQAAGDVALAENAKLDEAAASHNDDMVARDYFAHDGPAGDTLVSRLLDVGYTTLDAVFTVGENLAMASGTSTTPQGVVSAWMNSAEHRANILNAAYRETGVAVAATAPVLFGLLGQGTATYTQEFGVTGP